MWLYLSASPTNTNIKTMERMKKIFFLISLLTFSVTSHAEYDRYWLELSTSFVEGSTFKLKARDGNTGWSLIHSRYTEDKFLGPADYNRATLEKLDTEYRVYGVSKFISAPFNWGYAEVGLGLGYGNGSWSENCTDYEESWFGTSQKCDLKEGGTFGFPFHASATVGRYIGIGVNVDVFLSLERGTVSQFGIVIPFGLFTK